MKQIAVEPLFNDNIDLQSINKYKDIINQYYINSYMSIAFGIRTEDLKINEQTGVSSAFYSVPESYEDGWFDESDNVEKILKELAKNIISSIYKISILVDDELDINFNDKLEQELLNNTKFYVKQRKDEVWGNDKSEIALSHYQQKIEDSLDNFITKLNTYKDYKEV